MAFWKGDREEDMLKSIRREQKVTFVSVNMDILGIWFNFICHRLYMQKLTHDATFGEHKPTPVINR